MTLYEKLIYIDNFLNNQENNLTGDDQERASRARTYLSDIQEKFVIGKYNQEIITSPYGTSFEKGTKVYSYGDKTTFGFIESWDYANDCWRLERELNVYGSYLWWPEGEPTKYFISDVPE